MLVLSDCPERLGGLARVQDGLETPAYSLPPGDRALWRTLGGADRLWRGTGRDPGPSGFWSHAVILAEAASSQFDALREALGEGLGLPGPTAAVALTGRGFHGQRDRPWASAPGNLHLSAVVPGPGLSAAALPALPMLPVVALVDAVRALSGETLRPGIKWVNDVLVDGRKLGGVLTSTQTRGDQVTAVLLGIGLNLATAPPVPPTPFVPRVGCLADAGTRVTWEAAMAAVLAALGRRLTELIARGPAALLDAYRHSSLVIDREVCVCADRGPGETRVEVRPAPILRGTVRAIAADLSLILEGVEAPVTGGRLAFAEDWDRFDSR